MKRKRWTKAELKFLDMAIAKMEQHGVSLYSRIKWLRSYKLNHRSWSSIVSALRRRALK